MATLQAIQTRYAGEVETAHCGCANLWPFLNIQPGQTILDLGSGNGIQTYAFCEKVGPTGTAFGLDLTPEMITKAQQQFSRPNLHFVQGDIAALPFQDNMFDLVTSNCVINHASDKSKVYMEIFRTLKNSGQFVISDVCALDTITSEEANDPVKIAECWAGAIPRQKYLELIESAGFTQVEIRSAREYTKAGHLLESIIVSGVKK